MKELTTLDEFAKWAAYFARRRQEHEKPDWYLASVAQMIGTCMGGSKLPLEKYLLRFDPPKPVETKPEDSKAIWMAALFPQNNPEPVYTSTEKIIP